MTAYPEAVQAAAEALRQRGHACPYHRTPRLPGGLGDCETCLAVVNDARAAVAAAAPHIEAAVRREVAAACRAERDRVKALADGPPYDTESDRALVLKADAWEKAARIAEGGTSGEARNGSATPPETGAQDSGEGDRG